MDSWQLNFFVDLNELFNDFEFSENYGGMWAEDKADTPIKWTFTVPESGKTVAVVFNRHDGNGIGVESTCTDALDAFIKTPLHRRLVEIVCEEWDTELTVALNTNPEESDCWATMEEYRWDEDASMIKRIK